MAIFGTLETLKKQTADVAHFQAAWAYLDEAYRPGSATQQRILKLAAGASERVDLGGGVFALEQANLTKVRTEGVYESHRVYIDVQAVIAGTEAMEVCAIGRLTLREDLTPTKDLLFYHDSTGGSRLVVPAGEAAVFFPADGHKPCVCADAPALVHKVVIKVPVR